MGFLIGFLLTYLSITILWYIIFAIANWMIFRKAGEAGWKAIIPLYNTYISFKISWNTSMLWVMVGCFVISAVLSVFNSALGITLSSALSLVACVIGIMQTHMLSKAFGHGVGFTLGLLFLNPIFILILGFGGAKYRGAQR